MMSINEARKRGVAKVRCPQWSIWIEHMDISGPQTARLYSPVSILCAGRDPVDIPFAQLDLDTREWEPYTGPDSNSEVYRAARAFVRQGMQTPRIPVFKGGIPPAPPARDPAGAAVPLPTWITGTTAIVAVVLYLVGA